jgi:glycosyltransferase involved in cell wall biosynthesis
MAPDQLRWLMTAVHVPPSGTRGGMVRYTVELARALNARSDVELSVMTVAESRSFFEALLGDPTRVHTIPRSPKSARPFFERNGLSGLAARRQWDVIHGTKHLLPRTPKGRRVLTVHDALILDRPGDFPRLKRTLLPRAFLSAIHEADVLVCPSEATRTRLLAHAPFVANRTRVVWHAVSPSLLTVPAQPVTELSGRQFGLVVGDPSPRKNLGWALRVWEEVSARRPGARLAMVGPSGWGITDIGDHGGKRKDVLLLGHLPEAQLRWCYEHASVVLCPSFCEGFGLPTLEAVELGSRVLTSTDPALIEVAGDRAEHIPVDRQSDWVDVVLDALDHPTPRAPARPPPREWSDVAEETVRAVRP